MAARAAALAARCHARLDRLLAGSGVNACLLAFSGGLDSTVLLHLLRDYARTHALALQAHHVDHALQDGSAAWAMHCAALAARLDVEYSTTRLDGTPPAAASIEDWAREQRYACLLARSDAHTALLTAHHQDDQAETVLLHALRASGPHGLAGIRAQGRYGDKPVWRPLLNEARADLRAYAELHALSWIEDPSNGERRFARNRMRAEVLPVLEQAFPGAAAALAEVARLQGEVVEVIESVADQLLGAEENLSLRILRDSASALRPYLLKRWLARRGGPQPGRAQLQEMLNGMLHARVDGEPRVTWRGVAVRRYDDRYFLTAADLPMPRAESTPWVAPWTALDTGHGELVARDSVGQGASRRALGTALLTVRYRRGGERLRLHDGGPRRELKALFQQWRIPPWQRARWPLLYVGEQLAVVAGLAVAAEFAARGDDAGVVFNWRSRD